MTPKRQPLICSNFRSETEEVLARESSDGLEAQGFDQALAREFFGEFSQKLVLLDTMGACSSPEQLQAFAEFVDRPAEIIHTGLDFFRAYLMHHISEWRRD